MTRARLVLRRILKNLDVDEVLILTVVWRSLTCRWGRWYDYVHLAQETLKTEVRPIDALFETLGFALDNGYYVVELENPTPMMRHVLRNHNTGPEFLSDQAGLEHPWPPKRASFLEY